MKKQVWVDVKDPSELRIGDRVRFTDVREHLEAGAAIGDDGGRECDRRFFRSSGRIGRASEMYGGYSPAELLDMWGYVQVLRTVEDYPDSKTMAFDVLCAVHEVLHDVPEYSAFVTLKDGRQVQVRGMVLAAIEELDKWQKGEQK